MIKRFLNRNRIAFLSFLTLYLISNVTLYSFFIDSNMMPTYLDVDRKTYRNTLICTFSFMEVLNYPNRMANQIPVEPNSKDHKIFEVIEMGIRYGN